ncbi:related to THO complex subunit 3 [Ustilago sp. UG-2017b]|nr:related to THO complex subunit 3 [Ustilago sp. UG-2017b]
MSLSFYPPPPTASTSKSTVARYMSTSFNSRSITLPNFSSLKTKDLRSGHRSSVRGLGWSIDGRKLATCSSDRTIRIWVPERSIDHRASTEIRGHTDSVDQLIWHPTNPELVATASGDKSVRIWDTRLNSTTETAMVVATPGANINLTYHPTGNYIAVGDKSDTVSIIDCRKRKAIHTVCSRSTCAPAGDETFDGATVMGSYDEINELSYSSDGSLLFLSSGSGSIHMHHTCSSRNPYRRIHSHPAHTSNVFCIQHDPLSRFVATASSDAMISLWDSREWFSHKMVTSLAFPARAIGFSFDGELLASGGEDAFISINATDPSLGVRSGSGDQVCKIPLGQGTMINTLSWHPSKYLLAFAGDQANSKDPALVRVCSL